MNGVTKETFVETPRGRIRVLEAGAGWPIVLLHAFPLSADMWRPQLDRVADGWRVIAPDLPGFGPAPIRPASPGTVDDMAEAVDLVLRALEIEEATIGGLSMGGYVTFALYRRSPGRFTGVVLADTKATPDTVDGREARHRMIDLVRREGAPAAVAGEMLPKLLGETSRRERPEVVRTIREAIERNGVDGIVAALEALASRPDSTDLLASISCPALIVVGSEDTVTPRVDAEAMQRGLSRSRLVVLPEAGHLSNLETPDAFSQAVADFLGSNL